MNVHGSAFTVISLRNMNLVFRSVRKRGKEVSKFAKSEGEIDLLRYDDSFSFFKEKCMPIGRA